MISQALRIITQSYSLFGHITATFTRIKRFVRFIVAGATGVIIDTMLGFLLNSLQIRIGRIRIGIRVNQIFFVICLFLSTSMVS